MGISLPVLLPPREETTGLRLRQVFRLANHPTSDRLPGLPQWPHGRFRPRLRRRDRVGFSPTSLNRNQHCLIGYTPEKVLSSARAWRL